MLGVADRRLLWEVQVWKVCEASVFLVSLIALESYNNVGRPQPSDNRVLTPFLLLGIHLLCELIHILQKAVIGPLSPQGSIPFYSMLRGEFRVDAHI